MSTSAYRMLGYHETTVRVRFGEIDRYGYMWHGHAMACFEIFRADIARKFGLRTSDLLDTELTMPMAEAGCVYRNPAYEDEQLNIQGTLLRPALPAPFLVFIYRALKDGDVEVFRGRTRQIFVRQDGRLITRLPDAIRERLTTLWGHLADCPVWEDGREVIESLVHVGETNVEFS